MKRFVMIICLAGLALLSVHSYNIPLKGQLAGGGPKNGSPVEAFQNQNDVSITFNTNLGKLKVDISDEFGNTVFLTSVNATNGSSLTIDTYEMDGGVYYITICNGNNECLEGSFVI